MQLTLSIGKLEDFVYVGQVRCGDEEIGTSVIYKSIASAICSVAGSLRNGDAWYIDVEYGGFSSGDYPIEDLFQEDRAEVIAKRLVYLVAEDRRRARIE
ncbi:hypothetical protein [Variovorax sp. Sphag1AA]|uniref:hypothetical protein n=1 Tax=Variovorax sp. Sphag1AA TaxID=2587027 RepID=UPI00160F9C96|nr:hypothetical protein [Variovorax sp. Sphag1AA]MBB3181005.1 hypothetical protein [Variovorax sp. Sphag1AA]